METLSALDLAALQTALEAVANGDLTVAADISTTKLEAEEGYALGRLGEIFNQMLEQIQASVHGYDEMRERVAGMLRQISTETQAVAAASQQMATTSEETGRAIGEIASAVGEVASGAERQVRTVGDARRDRRGRRARRAARRVTTPTAPRRPPSRRARSPSRAPRRSRGRPRACRRSPRSPAR